MQIMKTGRCITYYLSAISMYIIYSFQLISPVFLFSAFFAVLVQRKLLVSVQSCQDCRIKFKYVFKIDFSLKQLSFFI